MRAPCPVCAGAVEIPRRATHVVCPYCRSESRIEREGELPALPGERVIRVAKEGASIAARLALGIVITVCSLFLILALAYIGE